MATAIAAFRERLSRVEPWVAVAALIALGLILWGGFQGTSYWTASRDLEPLRTRIAQFDRAMQDSVPKPESLEADLASRRELLDQWKDRFRYEGFPETDPLLNIISNTAFETRVSVTFVVIGDRNLPEDSKLGFQTQIMKLSIEGDTHARFDDFLSALHRTLPIFSVSEISLAGFSGKPTAQVTLLFDLAPLPDPEEEAEQESAS